MNPVILIGEVEAALLEMVCEIGRRWRGAVRVYQGRRGPSRESEAA
jgi:hypothetical protein